MITDKIAQRIDNKTYKKAIKASKILNKVSTLISGKQNRYKIETQLSLNLISYNFEGLFQTVLAQEFNL